MDSIEFYFDCSSPWTYLGFHNVQKLASEFSVSIRWKPILVGGIFNSVNPSVYESRRSPVPAKVAYAQKSLQDWARWSGLSINGRPAVFPVNSVKVMRACIVLDREGQLPAFARAAFEAYWRDDLDISQESVVRRLCGIVGVDGTSLLSAIDDPAVKAELRSNTDELVRRGGFGSPTVFVGEDMYFGNDHLPLVEAALERNGARARTRTPSSA